MGTVKKGQKKRDWLLLNRLKNDFPFMKFWYISTENRRRQQHPTPVLLPGESHGRRSLVGCSPWGHEESDTTERLHFSFSCIGEGNGNPLHCSCPENPRDGGAWWAAVYGVTQSRTWLKWRSSSSSNLKMNYISRMYNSTNYCGRQAQGMWFTLDPCMGI